MRDVCLIVEGTYPRVTGGVAEWVHQLTSNLPAVSFSVVSLAAEDSSLLAPAYALPANVELVELPFDFDRPDVTRAVEGLLPEAAVYHAAATGAAGVLGARVAQARGRRSILTEHGVAWEEARFSPRAACHHHRASARTLDSARQSAWFDLYRRLAVEAYDTAHAGISRRDLIRRWIAPAGGLALAALVGGRIAGIGVIRPSREGYCTGPLVADTPEIAEQLLDSLCSHADGQVMALDVPESNSDALTLAASHGFRTGAVIVRMTRGPAPKTQWQQIYGFNSLHPG